MSDEMPDTLHDAAAVLPFDLLDHVATLAARLRLDDMTYHDAFVVARTCPVMWRGGGKEVAEGKLRTEMADVVRSVQEMAMMRSSRFCPTLEIPSVNIPGARWRIGVQVAWNTCHLDHIGRQEFYDDLDNKRRRRRPVRVARLLQRRPLRPDRRDIYIQIAQLSAARYVFAKSAPQLDFELPRDTRRRSIRVIGASA